MITLYLREHGTHNLGYSIDFVANLDNYTNDNDLVEDLFNYTREKFDEEEIEKYYLENMEEWLITDWELEGNLKLRFNEYANLQKLIDLNETLNELDDIEIKLVSCFIDSGYTEEQAIEKVKSGDVYYFEGRLEDWAEEMVEEGLLGEVDEKILSYIDYEKVARDLAMDGYTYDYKLNISYSTY